MEMIARTKAFSTHIAVVRATNRAAQRRAHAISYVMEIMDVFAVTVAMGHPVDQATLRNRAEQIVDGLQAMAHGEPS